MATLKFEVGKVYITRDDAFAGGEQTGKSVVIERTEGTVTFKHLASGEIFVREVKVFDAVQVESCEDCSFLADNFGQKIDTVDIETAEVENTAETETVESVAEVETAEGTVENVESAVEVAGNTAEPEQVKVEVCKAYDAKDIIAACYPVDIAKIEIFDARDIEPDDSPEIVETLICIEHTRQDILNYKKEVIHSESVIAENEKLIQLYAEENKTRHKDKSLDWLIEMQQDEIKTCRADIAYNKRLIEREEARLAKLEEKLAALKISKVAA